MMMMRNYVINYSISGTTCEHVTVINVLNIEILQQESGNLRSGANGFQISAQAPNSVDFSANQL